LSQRPKYTIHGGRFHHLPYLTKYIHRQALALQGETLALQGETLQDQPSSYPEYLGLRTTSWVHPEEVLAYFSKTNPKLSYKSFVEEQDEDASIILKDIDIED